MKRIAFLILFLALVAGGAYWYRQHGATDAQPQPQATQRGAGGGDARPLPVVIRPVEARPMPVQLTTVGTVQPLATVAVKARIESVVEAVHFTEGQEVKAGDLLFTLDPRPAEAQLRQAEANRDRDLANLERARTDARRYQELLKRDAVARQQYDTAISQANALEATVKADQAAIDAARLTLNYTRITAPMDGRTGAILVRPGNTVRPGDAGALVTLTRIRPISVAFNVAERELAAVRQAAAGPLTVRATIPGDGAGPAEGRLSFIDSAVDPQSGTIQLKAQFDNTDTRLWPGQYVEVVLVLRVDPQAPTVPVVAVQTSQQGPYVWVVRPDQTVEMRPVTVDRTVDGLSVIAKGLTPGERVVVDGQSRLTPDAKVAERGKDSDKPQQPSGGMS
ncbi:MAG TPA: efflux RND transporter periplasmic adaptor subunit [Azospirillaceae bacterium]|nr:efflux RND transporter periplasmic adaptor subunit [Azospirillaceae bacterium]